MGILHEYSDGDTVFEAYIAGIDDCPGPTVLLAHDWSGINAGMRRNAERIAELGYTCFALDVYGKGRRGNEPGDNHHLMNRMLEDRAELRRRLLAGLTAATEHPSVDSSRIAALGYCFGGLCVLDMARANPANLKGVIRRAWRAQAAEHRPAGADRGKRDGAAWLGRPDGAP